MNYLISLAVIVAGFYGMLHVPLHYLEFGQPPQTLGSTITTIQGTDTISSSRSVINTNFANLNADKIEATVGTLSQLSSIGTITTGVWNATPITVPYGGTGSTTLSTNQVLLGNGTSALNVVAGVGTSGYLLTSNGAATAPTWQANGLLLANNTFSGTNTFNATTTIAASSATNNALILNGAKTQWPSANSSGVLTNNGSGVLTWAGATVRYNYATTTAISVGSSNNATTTSFVVPANVITASSTITFYVAVSSTQGSNNDNTFYLRDTNNNTYVTLTIPDTLASGGFQGYLQGAIYLGNSASSQTSFGQATLADGVVSISFNNNSSATAVNMASGVSFVGVLSSGGGTVSLSRMFMQVTQ